MSDEDKEAEALASHVRAGGELEIMTPWGNWKSFNYDTPEEPLYPPHMYRKAKEGE